jgi:hypothetical protein
MMLKLLRFLVIGDMHNHEWETINNEKVTLYGDDTKMAVGFIRIYVLRCKKCGKVKFCKIQY